jgi:hypothetical protein
LGSLINSIIYSKFAAAYPQYDLEYAGLITLTTLPEHQMTTTEAARKEKNKKLVSPSTPKRVKDEVKIDR